VKFQLHGRVYDAASLLDVSLTDVLTFEGQLWAMAGGTAPICAGAPVNWDRVMDWANQGDERELTADEQFWLMGVMIWASRRVAGDQLSFAEAVDFPVDEVTWLPEPADHKKPANPTRRPPRARTGSGPAAKPRETEPGSERTGSGPLSAAG
jgi:hypothetical protein